MAALNVTLIKIEKDLTKLVYNQIRYQTSCQAILAATVQLEDSVFFFHLVMKKNKAQRYCKLCC